MSAQESDNLRIPGPTPLPPEVRQAAAAQMINHRGPQFAALLAEATAGLQEFLGTESDVLILTCSGTGALEAAIVNTLSPGDKVLSVSIGHFGDRFAAIAQAYGAHVVTLGFEWGTAAAPERVAQALAEDPEIVAALVTHNETSTGVTNDLAALGRVVKTAGPLLLVDVISSAGCIELQSDAWGCDVAVGGSQKGWMAPPGLGFVSMNPRAWDAYRKARMPRFYMDLGKAKASAEKGQTPWTPALSVLYALVAGLRLMRAEGLSNIIARHHRMGRHTRQGIRAAGLELLVADERHASNMVTAVRVPDGWAVKDLLQRLRTDHHVVLAGAQGILAGRVFRIGHLGHCSEADIDSVLAALRQVLPRGGAGA